MTGTALRHYHWHLGRALHPLSDEDPGLLATCLTLIGVVHGGSGVTTLAARRRLPLELPLVLDETFRKP